MRLDHGFDPVFDHNSRILILGTFPSVASRKEGFYYGNPQNRFWRMLSAVYEKEVPKSVAQKKELLSACGAALWDVVKSCEIKGSSDASIQDVVPNDIAALLSACPIERIYANGGTAFALYRKYVLPVTGREILRLPSTSPANAVCSLEKLIFAWKTIAR